MVEAVPVSFEALELIPPLRAALDGTGPAVVPVPVGQVVAPVPLDGWERETALVITTSGSTGVPKSVLLSASALRASAEATHARLGGPGRWLLALPATHIAGVQVLVRSLVAGTSPAVLDLAPGFRAERFAEVARPLLATSGPHYTALVPTQLARLVAEDVSVLKEFDGVLLGGAATPRPLLDAALAAGVRVVTTYGMSETAGGCVYDGVPLDGVEVRLVDGRIEVAGPTLALGYRGERFADGWFRTGDLGRFRVDGTLEVLGRADDVIVTGGEKVPPVLVERALAGVPGVREVCVVGVPDPEWGQVVVAAVVAGGVAPSEEVLREVVRAAVGRAAVPKRVLFLPELPTRGPGKVDRAAVARSFG
ncbi:o-succinylbenzoate--CoA ligase [Umezawaea sp.]|uniref:o-succinylbenzoate--CoA ligase n=1 Tax=Umezawaea sp. TaxID=1955258 RepID=UPI002ECFED26